MANPKSLLVKHLVDRLAAAQIICGLAPLFVAIGTVIKLEDGGPVFFRQARLGTQGKIFQIWKFRTMVENADDLLRADGSVDAPRTTRIGKILRYLSLDELPQLLNILAGEMSLVGPRPVLEAHLERYTAQQLRRLEMRPGVTGLAQVNGRNNLLWSKRIEYDIEYVDSYSLLLDLEILLKTVKVVLFREGVVLDRNPGQVDDLAAATSKESS